MTDLPRLVVEVPWGPHAGRKAVVRPGGRLRVGRGDRADLILPGDAGLSALHFELAWDGAKGTVRDLGKSVHGVEIAGSQIKEASVGHGAWIRASRTDFRLWIEGAPLPSVYREDPAPRDDDEEGRLALDREAARNEDAFRARLVQVFGQLAREGELHAVLDGARASRIRALLSACVDPSRSLYEGTSGEAMADIAPYLVRFVEGSPLLERLVLEGWGKRWGVFFTTRQPFKEARRHLRRFLMVTEEETGERLYFRFYDPEVLRLFLPTCTIRQAEEFWAEIDTFFFEDEGGDVERQDREVALANARIVSSLALRES